MTMKHQFATCGHFLPLIPYKFLLILLFFFTSCSGYRPTSENPTPLYEVIPCHRSAVPPGDVASWMAWAIFGNDDDGIYGEGPKAHYYPNYPNTVGKFWRWWLRNPLHNFTFYVIGSADRQNSAFTVLKIGDKGCALLCKNRRKATEFPFYHGGIYIAFHGGKPYVSMRLPITGKRCLNFYFGWRCRGNFGIKLQPFAEK